MSHAYQSQLLTSPSQRRQDAMGTMRSPIKPQPQQFDDTLPKYGGIPQNRYSSSVLQQNGSPVTSYETQAALLDKYNRDNASEATLSQNGQRLAYAMSNFSPSKSATPLRNYGNRSKMYSPVATPHRAKASHQYSNLVYSSPVNVVVADLEQESSDKNTFGPQSERHQNAVEAILDIHDDGDNMMITLRSPNEPRAFVSDVDEATTNEFSQNMTSPKNMNESLHRQSNVQPQSHTQNLMSGRSGFNNINTQREQTHPELGKQYQAHQLQTPVKVKKRLDMSGENEVSTPVGSQNPPKIQPNSNHANVTVDSIRGEIRNLLGMLSTLENNLDANENSSNESTATSSKQHSSSNILDDSDSEEDFPQDFSFFTPRKSRDIQSMIKSTSLLSPVHNYRNVKQLYTEENDTSQRGSPRKQSYATLSEAQALSRSRAQREQELTPLDYTMPKRHSKSDFTPKTLKTQSRDENLLHELSGYQKSWDQSKVLHESQVWEALYARCLQKLQKCVEDSELYALDSDFGSFGLEKDDLRKQRSHEGDDFESFGRYEHSRPKASAFHSTFSENEHRAQLRRMEKLENYAKLCKKIARKLKREYLEKTSFY